MYCNNSPILIAQKPFDTNNKSEGVLKNGVGSYNIDSTRIEYQNEKDKGDNKRFIGSKPFNVDKGWNNNKIIVKKEFDQTKGRFPSNTIISHSINCTNEKCSDDCSVKIMNEQSGELLKAGNKKECTITTASGSIYGNYNKIKGIPKIPNDNGGGASRFFKKCNYSKDDFESFFYTSKTSQLERNLGCNNLPDKQIKEKGGARTFNDRCKNCGKKFIGEVNICECENPETDSTAFQQKNNHPCVKPLSIIIYLLKTFITPIDNFIIVDPFLGSGSTGMASVLFDNVKFIGIELDKNYYEIAKARCEWAEKNKLEMKRNLDEKKCKIDYNEMKTSSHQGNISEFF